MYPPNSYSSGQNHYGAPTPCSQPPGTRFPVNPTTQCPSNYARPPAGARIPWSSGLFDCCLDMKSCFITFICPCIAFGRIAEIVDRGPASCGSNGVLYGLLTCIPGFSCIYSTFYRIKLREQYKLETSPCGDYVAHLCCEACALSQEYRELQNRGYNMALGWKGNAQQMNCGVVMAPIRPTFEPVMTR